MSSRGILPPLLHFSGISSRLHGTRSLVHFWPQDLMLVQSFADGVCDLRHVFAVPLRSAFATILRWCATLKSLRGLLSTLPPESWSLV